MKWSMPSTEWNSTTRKIDEIFLLFRCNGNVGRENSTCTDESGRRTHTVTNHAFPNCVFHERTFRNFSPFQRHGPYLDSMANEALIFFCMREVFFFCTASQREAANIDKSAWRKKRLFMNIVMRCLRGGKLLLLTFRRRKFSVHCLEQAVAVEAEVAITFLLNFWWKIKNVCEGCKRASEMAERRQDGAKQRVRPVNLAIHLALTQNVNSAH